LGYGLQLEYGYLGTVWGVYGGFRHEFSGKDHRYSSGSYDWQGDRVVLGGRFGGASQDPGLHPFVGLGITYGWATRTSSYQDWYDYGPNGVPTNRGPVIHVRQKSKGTGGWLVEFGTNVATRGPLQVVLRFRYEDTNLRFGSSPRGNLPALDNVDEASAQMGLVYVFPTAHRP
jgi:hypothetical protein